MFGLGVQVLKVNQVRNAEKWVTRSQDAGALMVCVCEVKNPPPKKQLDFS